MDSELRKKIWRLRGPGDIAGTRQSGLLDFKLADIVRDREILQRAAQSAHEILENDPELDFPDHTGFTSTIKAGKR